MPIAKGKVLVAMSGGVDSSVAAALLMQQGYEVVGCFMRLGTPGDQLDEGFCDPATRDSGGPQPALRIHHQGCCSINDAKDAQLVAAKLGVSFYVLNFKRDFGRIIRYFTDEYHAGRTPNPCVRCNDWLKFGKLADYARSIDAQFIASGHYARTDTIDGQPALLRGLDESKDQSYVLFGAKRENLAHTLLPIGGYRKTQIRQLALDLGLPVHNKPDSQEICFVPSNNYMDVVSKTLPTFRAHDAQAPHVNAVPPYDAGAGFTSGAVAIRPGPLVDTTGHELGQHPGHQHFTIGQRRGIGVALGHPLYVIDKDAATNTVTVGPRQALFAAGLVARQTNWLVDPPTSPMRCRVKIRYNASLVPAVAHMQGDELHVTFDDPQSAVAPGQAVVCYGGTSGDGGERVLGGGWIDRAMR